MSRATGRAPDESHERPVAPAIAGEGFAQQFSFRARDRARNRSSSGRLRQAITSTSTDSFDDERLLLNAAIARGIGNDDVVVQRRLLQNARLLEIGGDTYRGAVALGLDAGDPIIARRLVQQMRLQLEHEARQAEPTDAELRQYLIEHSERFAIPERVRVEQVFFSAARRGERAERDARCSVNPGSDGTSCPASALRGDSSLWPGILPLQSVADLEKIFGAAAPAVAASPLDVWTGPHRSALGYHVVRVTERAPVTMPSFASIRAAVRLALLNERAAEHVQHALR